jgi:hypothetical protein
LAACQVLILLNKLHALQVNEVYDLRMHLFGISQHVIRMLDGPNPPLHDLNGLVKLTLHLKLFSAWYNPIQTCIRLLTIVKSYDLCSVLPSSI